MADRFDASIKREHQVVLSNVMGRMQGGATVVLTDGEFKDLSDLAGALNFYAGQAPSPPPTYPHTRLAIYEYDPSIVQVKYVGEPGLTYAIPIRLPPFPCRYQWSQCEFQGPPAGWRAKLSLIAGDVDGAAGNGPTPSIMIDVGSKYAPGSIVYVNTALEPNIDYNAPVHFDCIVR